MGMCSDPACWGHEHDMATAELCRHPGCGQRWTVDIEWADGWSAFMCDEHWELYAGDDDPVHGRVVSVSGSWSDLPDEIVHASVAAQADGRPVSRQVRRQRQREARKRSRH